MKVKEIEEVSSQVAGRKHHPESNLSKPKSIMDKKKLAVIHIVKKELSLSDDEYRNILERVTGVRSARDLNEKQFRKLMQYFVRTRHYRATSKGITMRQKYYLRQLIKKLQWDDAHFLNYIHKYFHNRELESYSKHDASNLIVALKAILNSRRPPQS